MIFFRSKLYSVPKNNVGSIILTNYFCHLKGNNCYLIENFKIQLRHSSSIIRHKTNPIPPSSHLQHINDQFYPILRRPQEHSSDNKQRIRGSTTKKGIGSKAFGSSGLKIGLFLLAHAIPIGSAVYAFTILTSIQQADDEYISGETAEDITQDALKIIRVSKGCFALLNNSNFPIACQLEPHFPEENVLRLPEEQLIPGIQNNLVTDIIAGKHSEFSLPLNFIHFALNTNSSAYQAFLKNRRMSLLYYDSDRKISILMSGLAAIVPSKESKRHYWRSEWGQHFDNYEAPEYALIKFVPQSVKIYRRNGYSKEIERVVNDNIIEWKLVINTD